MTPSIRRVPFTVTSLSTTIVARLRGGILVASVLWCGDLLDQCGGQTLEFLGAWLHVTDASLGVGKRSTGATISS
jgi:hypothetical protein